MFTFKVGEESIMPKKKEKPESIVEKIIKELLDHLETKAQIKVSQDQEGAVHVYLETEEPGVLIGYHGQTLASIQLLTAMMVYRQQGEWVRVVVDVNDYRERREEALRRIALATAQKAKFSGESQALPPMSSAERRIVHLALADDPEVETVSEGEDWQRRVVVKPKPES